MKRQVFEVFCLEVRYDKAGRRIEIFATAGEAVAQAFKNAKDLPAEVSSRHSMGHSGGPIRPSERPSGRDATTVYYEKGGREIAYTIVSGDALDPPADARSTTRGGVEYRRFRDDGRTGVTWERDGHTCVLSGTAVRPAELVMLADWRGKGAIPF